MRAPRLTEREAVVLSSSADIHAEATVVPDGGVAAYRQREIVATTVSVSVAWPRS